jgi:hypothetical protein
MAIEDITIQFIATLSGVLLGIPVALWIDRMITKSHEKEKATFVLTALSQEITHNLELLGQIQRELQPVTMIYYNLDMNTMRVVSLADFEGIINQELLKRIFRIYYEYEHLNRKIDNQFSMHYSAIRQTAQYNTERGTIIGSILAQITYVKTDTEQLIKDIQTEIERLKEPTI